MKEAIAILSTDKHITPRNLSEMYDLFKQEIILAKERNVSNIIWLGDIFNSRESQRQEVLTFLSNILIDYKGAGLEIYCIPGNHDKTDYNSYDSFLDCFILAPHFHLLKEANSFTLGGVKFDSVPFFNEEKWLEEFNKIPKKEAGQILLSHIAVDGSVNNDGSKVSSEKIKPSMFKHYKSVFLGHYHNAQQVSKNIFHLPSTRQNNFGEDNEKGFTILYNDFSTEFIKSKFIEFEKFHIDLDNSSVEEAMELAKTIEKENVRITFEFSGSDDKLRALDKKFFINLGVSVTTKNKDVEVEDVEYAEEVKKMTDDDIIEHFKRFCEKNNYPFDEGIKYLK
jgi:exonuclease SbcD